MCRLPVRQSPCRVNCTLQRGAAAVKILSHRHVSSLFSLHYLVFSPQTASREMPLRHQHHTRALEFDVISSEDLGAVSLRARSAFQPAQWHCEIGTTDGRSTSTLSAANTRQNAHLDVTADILHRSACGELGSLSGAMRRRDRSARRMSYSLRMLT